MNIAESQTTLYHCSLTLLSKTFVPYEFRYSQTSWSQTNQNKKTDLVSTEKGFKSLWIWSTTDHARLPLDTLLT